MSKRIRSLAMLAWLGSSFLSADTITTRDQLSVNGSLVKLAGDEMTIVARYASRDKPTPVEKTFQVKRNDVDVLEFNATTMNSGAPPVSIGIGPPIKAGKIAPSPPEAADTIVLRGGQRRDCKLIEIDGQL